jgi:hypothetical protein
MTPAIRIELPDWLVMITLICCDAVQHCCTASQAIVCCFWGLTIGTGQIFLFEALKLLECCCEVMGSTIGAGCDKVEVGCAGIGFGGST